MSIAIKVNSLQSVNPAIGSNVIIQIISPRRKVALQLIGFIEGKSLIVTPPKKAIALSPSSLEGANVKVHIMLQSRICTFISRIVKIMPEPYNYWHIAYPSEIEVSNIRKNTRVELKMPVAIEYKDSQLALAREIPNIALCTDISMQGMGVEAPCALGKKGDEFSVSMRLSLLDIDQLILCTIVLRSAKESEPGVFQHGFEFVNWDDDSKVLAAAYIYRTMLVNLGYLDK